MPSHLIHICELQGSSAKLSRHPASLLLPQEGHLIHVPTYVSPSPPLPNEHVSDSNIRGQDPAWQVVLHMG